MKSSVTEKKWAALKSTDYKNIKASPQSTFIICILTLLKNTENIHALSKVFFKRPDIVEV